MANDPRNNKWTQPTSPPPPLFVGQAERNFVKQINDEVIERIIGQQLLYFPIDMERTNFEIVDAFEPRYLFGQDSDFADGTSLEVTAVCKEARRGLFDAGNKVGTENRRIS